MPDRLEDLRRQRALVQEQLAWLDREIAALVPNSLPSQLPGLAVTPAAMPRSVPLVAPTLPDLSEYQVDPMVTQADTRRGCLIYATIGFAIFFGALAAIYFFGYRDHPVFFADRPANNSAAEKSAPPSAPRPFK